MRYLPHTQEDLDSMLAAIGRSGIDDLFKSIPASITLGRDLNIPVGASEFELKRELLARSGTSAATCFIGAGATAHFVPELVSQILLRSEWYTAYTPYQPEVAQGTLQAVFEFQSMAASLYGCEIANASMYDGASALAEAILMAKRLKSTANIMLVSRAIHPEYRSVVKTYADAAGIIIEEIPLDANGLTDLAALEKLYQVHQDNIAAVAFQTPNFFGQLEDGEKIVADAHAKNILAIAANTEPVAFGAIASPGNYGADICVGEGIGLCGALHLGAPGVGLFATSKQFVRQMPGRLAGETVDSEGQRGFVLTLATREQHIRRERATSNICTNHNLMALAFSITLSTYGKNGFEQLARENIAKTLRFRELAQKNNLEIAFVGPHFNETVLKFGDDKTAQERLHDLAQKGIIGGCLLSTWYPELSGCVMIATTELHSEAEMDELLEGLSNAAVQKNKKSTMISCGAVSA